MSLDGTPVAGTQIPDPGTDDGEMAGRHRRVVKHDPGTPRAPDHRRHAGLDGVDRTGPDAADDGERPGGGGGRDTPRTGLDDRAVAQGDLRQPGGDHDLAAVDGDGAGAVPPGIESREQIGDGRPRVGDPDFDDALQWSAPSHRPVDQTHLDRCSDGVERGDPGLELPADEGRMLPERLHEGLEVGSELGLPQLVEAIGPRPLPRGAVEAALDGPDHVGDGGLLPSEVGSQLLHLRLAHHQHVAGHGILLCDVWVFLN